MCFNLQYHMQMRDVGIYNFVQRVQLPEFNRQCHGFKNFNVAFISWILA